MWSIQSYNNRIFKHTWIILLIRTYYILNIISLKYHYELFIVIQYSLYICQLDENSVFIFFLTFLFCLSTDKIFLWCLYWNSSILQPHLNLERQIVWFLPTVVLVLCHGARAGFFGRSHMRNIPLWRFFIFSGKVPRRNIFEKRIGPSNSA